MSTLMHFLLSFGSNLCTDRLIARCASSGASQVIGLCDAGTGGCGGAAWRLRLCAALIEQEVIPQAARWHRRDLSPALLAAWHAVLTALREATAAAAAAAAGAAPAVRPAAPAHSSKARTASAGRAPRAPAH